MRCTRIPYGAVLSVMLIGGLFEAHAGETDQYLTWDIELEDSSEPFNCFFNDQIDAFLERANRRNRRIDNEEELVEQLYLYLFQGLHSSRVKKWLKHSEQVDRFPEDSVSLFEYQRMSIYRDPSFPFILPMARTIRLNDVYFGIDKVGHFFGFGRRYYVRYSRCRDVGLSDEQAMEKVVRWGIHAEKSLVGQLVDGIFSYADLEANFQGFRMAKNLCGGDYPYIVHNGDRWSRVRDVDIRDYVTPGFDESYNNSSYWGLRRRNVLPILRDEYVPKASLPGIQERFARYRRARPSFSSRMIAHYFEERGKQPQEEQSLHALRSEVN